MSTTNAKRLAELKQAVEDNQTEKDRAAGALEAAEQELKSLGYKTVAAAEKALKKLRRKGQDLEDKIANGLDELEGEYGELVS